MKPLRVLISALAVLFVAGVGLSGSASASAASHPAFVRVVPIRQTVTVHGNKPAYVTVRIENQTTHAEHFDTGVAGFRELRNGSMTGSGISPLVAKWVTVTPAHFILRPGEVKTVHAVIRPTFYAPGDHDIAVAFRFPSVTKHARRKGKTVSVTVSITGLSDIIVYVPGPTHKSTAVHLSAPSFSTGGPIPVTLTVTDHGNVLALMNNLVATDSPSAPIAHFPGLLVLAGASRTVTEDWQSPPLLCLPCHIHLAGAEANVYVFPAWYVGGAILILAALFCLWWFGFRGRVHLINTRKPVTPTGRHGIPGQ